MEYNKLLNIFVCMLVCAFVDMLVCLYIFIYLCMHVLTFTKRILGTLPMQYEELPPLELFSAVCDVIWRWYYHLKVVLPPVTACDVIWKCILSFAWSSTLCNVIRRSPTWYECGTTIWAAPRIEWCHLNHMVLPCGLFFSLCYALHVLLWSSFWSVMK